MRGHVVLLASALLAGCALSDAIDEAPKGGAAPPFRACQALPPEPAQPRTPESNALYAQVLGQRYLDCAERLRRVVAHYEGR